MKKVLLTMVAALGLFVVACSSPKDKAVDIIKDATEQVKEAKTAEDIAKITEEMEAKGKELNLTAEEEKELIASQEFKDATTELTAAVAAKTMELAGK